jgi:Ca-activated chloride channel homolog
MKFSKIISLVALAGMVFSCNNTDPAPGFELHLNYWNPTGTNPSVSFDKTNTSPEIKIDFTKRFESIIEGTTTAKVLIDNFRIIGSANQNYRIDAIDAYEYKEDLKDWKKDVEFKMTYGFVRDLSVVLVLDASASLGADFTNVKSYAKAFVDQTFLQTPNAKLGIVSFSTNVYQSPKFYTNKDEAKRYIDAMKQEDFTTLYDAMNAGLTMLNNQPSEAKAMVTFTDGTDNNSKTATAASLSNTLKAEAKTKIASYMIGLTGKGGVDQTILKGLVANGGIAAFPVNVVELQTVFKKFSTSVSNVYNLTYIRTQQPILEANARKLKFIIAATAL